MRRAIAMAAVSVVGLQIGCAREAINTTCEWPSEEPVAIDLDSAQDVRHLIADAQHAEDIAIRFADAEHGRRTGYSGHGGLLENGRVVNDCRTALFDAIVRTHQVPMERVLASLTVRPRLFDAGVFVSFAVVYACLIWFVVPIVLRRFSADGRWPVLGALLFASLVASVIGLQLGELWAITMEMLRLGNDHLTRRGLRIPWGQHRAVIFQAAVVVFWAVAATRLWLAQKALRVGTVEGLG